MAITHSTFTRNNMAESNTGLLNGGAGGYMQFLNVANGPVATLQFSQPSAFGAALDGVCEANEISPDVNAVGGTIAKAGFFSPSDELLWLCTVTGPGGGGDIELTSVIVTPGQVVVLEQLSYIAPA